MTIDIHTLAIILSLTNGLQVIGLAIQSAVTRDQRALGWWTGGNAVLALGFVCNYLRDIPGVGPLAIVANNVLFAAGLELIYVGVLRFFGRRAPRGWLIAFTLVFTLAIIVFTYWRDDIGARRVLISSGLVGLFGLLAGTLLRYKTPPVTAAAHFLASVFLLSSVFFFARALTPFTSLQLGGIFSATLTQTATYLAVLTASSLWTLGFIILVNQRLTGEIQAAKVRFELIFNTSPDAAIISRLHDGVMVEVNDAFVAMTGYSRAEALGKSTLEIPIWKEAIEREQLVARLVETGFCENMEAVFRRQDGSLLDGSVSAKLLQLQGAAHILSVTRDITGRKRMETALRESEEKFHDLADLLPQIVFETDARGNLTYLNKQAYLLFGYSGEESVLGVSSLTFHTPEERPRVIANVQRRLAGQPADHNEYAMLKRDGSTFPALVYSNPFMKDGRPAGLRGLIVDITERKQLEEKLQQQATTDGLTGVTNRRRFLELAHSEVKRVQRLERPLALALIDLDCFKRINDSYGHAIGDQALLTLTQIGQKNIRGIDVFARFGGDEFILLLPETTGEQAYEVLERIRQALAAQPADLSGQQVAMTISAGIAGLAGGEQTLDALMEHADRALYQAKAAGRNRVALDGASADFSVGPEQYAVG